MFQKQNWGKNPHNNDYNKPKKQNERTKPKQIPNQINLLSDVRVILLLVTGNMRLGEVNVQCYFGELLRRTTFTISPGNFSALSLARTFYQLGFRKIKISNCLELFEDPYMINREGASTTTGDLGVNACHLLWISVTVLTMVA